MTNRRDLMRGTLASMLLVLFSGTLVALFKYPLPESNKDILVYMAGQLSGMLGTALAFYFATTKNSEEKTHMLATRPAGTPSDPVNIDIPEPEFGR